MSLSTVKRLKITFAELGICYFNEVCLVLLSAYCNEKHVARSDDFFIACVGPAQAVFFFNIP